MQKLRPLNEDQRSLLMHALKHSSRGDRHAAKDARACTQCQDRPGFNGLGKMCRTCHGTGYVPKADNIGVEGLARTLESQAEAADRLYELIENADSVEVSQ